MEILRYCVVVGAWFSPEHVSGVRKRYKHGGFELFVTEVMGLVIALIWARGVTSQFWMILPCSKPVETQSCWMLHSNKTMASVPLFLLCCMLMNSCSVRTHLKSSCHNKFS